MILFWHHKYYLHQIAIVTHHGLITKNSESDCTIDQEASKKRRNSDSYHACLIFLFVLFVELNIIVTMCWFLHDLNFFESSAVVGTIGD